MPDLSIISLSLLMALLILPISITFLLKLLKFYAYDNEVKPVQAYGRI
jgi:hypothetical protein